MQSACVNVILDAMKSDNRSGPIVENIELRTALEQNRKCFEEFAESSNDWVWEVDTQGRYTYVSSRVKTFLGYEPEEILGRTPFDLMPEAEAQWVAALFGQYVAQQKPFKYLRNVNLHCDGRRVVLETSGVPIFDENGTYMGYRGTDRDITESVEQKAALERAVQRYTAILETTRDGYVMIDAAGHILEVNAAYRALSGYDEAELLKMTVSELEAEGKSGAFMRCMEGLSLMRFDLFETWHRRKNGKPFEIEVAISYASVEGGRFFAMVRDITRRKKSEAQQQLASKVFDRMKEGVLITDANRQIVQVNDGFCAITGYTRSELVGNRPSMLSSGWHDRAFYTQMWETIGTTGSWHGELVDRKKSGEVYTTETSIMAVRGGRLAVTYYIAVSSDITLRKRHEKLINNLAYYDALTELPNRVLFEERFTSRMSAAKRYGTRLALFFIDMDNFKVINDTYGHLVGDRFLRDAAKRLQSLLREEDTVGRFGGDEFAMMVETFNHPADLGVIAEKVVAGFREPFVQEGCEFYTGASIGIALFPDDGESYSELMRAADTAMYQIKGSGKGGYAFYTRQMNETISAQMVLENGLRQAIERNELSLVYQPKVDTACNRVYGVEALLRWNHETLGFVSPERFIPIAEENGLINPIGLWVIRRALEEIGALHQQGYDDLSVSINLSSKQLQSVAFVAQLHEAVSGSRVDPARIELEITENQLMEQIGQVMPVLNEITALGIRISIDDFGTGYSSLSYLKKLPVSIIKIDRSFVCDIDKDADDRAIVSSIIALAASLGRDVIAEGAEKREHVELLGAMGCEKIQGYYFAKPMPLEVLVEFLAGWGKT